MALISKRDIKAEEELLFSYREKAARKAAKEGTSAHTDQPEAALLGFRIPLVECRCRSEECLGFLC